MRIAVLGTGDAQTDATCVPEPIAQSVTQGFEAILRPVPGAEFPATPAARQRTATAYVAAGRDAAATGDFAAILINTVGDYGLVDLRNAISLPVIGAGAAGMRLACDLGARFSIVTLWPPVLRFLYEPVLTQSGTATNCAGLHFLTDDSDLESMDEPDNPIVAIQTCQWVALERVDAACRAALAEDGSDVIVLGCTCMAGMAPALKANGLPVVEPMCAGYLMAETVARLTNP